MSKKSLVKTEDQEVEVVNLSHVALGTYKSESTGEWMVAKLRFDPTTGAAEVVEHLYAGPGRDFAIEKFKIVAVQEGVVG